MKRAYEPSFWLSIFDDVVRRQVGSEIDVSRFAKSILEELSDPEVEPDNARDGITQLAPSLFLSLRR